MTSSPEGNHPQSRSNLWKAIGPGILVACAAVGGSHLVWSTRAGAIYGWQLLGLVLLANLFKFPFFLYGQRYAAASGESLLAGYRRQGIIYLLLFLTINLLTGVINIAAVGMLSGALLSGFGFIPASLPNITTGILIVCLLLILIGHYKLLDSLAKFVVIALALSTFTAVFLAFLQGGNTAEGFLPPSPWQWSAFPFLVFLLGWMPAPIDLSAWSSLWMFSRSKQTGHFATTRETTIDFYLGYIMAVVLAVAFLALGKLIMFGSGEAFSDSGIQFSNQLVGLYAESIGHWAKPLILSAAFITMFSTTLTCIDGYPRSLAACCHLLRAKLDFQKLTRFWVIIATIIAIVIVEFFTSSLIKQLKFAAAISFLTSPILAAINLKVMYSEVVPKSERPGKAMLALSLIGLAFFIAMSIGFIYVTYFRN